MARQVVTLRVEGINSKAGELEVSNSLRKYSGVLDVDVDPENKEVMVIYDPNNILAEDLKRTIEKAGYRVGQL